MIRTVGFLLALLVSCTPPSKGRTVQDSMGPVLVPENPARIVSLMPSLTETVFALGLGQRIVAVTSNDTFPPEVKQLPQVGGMRFHVEKVLQVNPDLILSHSTLNKTPEIDLLKRTGKSVFSFPEPQTPQEVPAQLAFAGGLLGARQEGLRLKEALEADFRDIKKKAEHAKPLLVWLEVSPDLYTAGTGTFLNSMIAMCGARNVAAESKGWVQWTQEAVIRMDPDVILVTHPEGKKIVLGRSAWKQLKAVKQARIYELDGDLVTRTGPRLGQGLRSMCHAIDGDVFP